MGASISSRLGKYKITSLTGPYYNLNSFSLSNIKVKSDLNAFLL